MSQLEDWPVYKVRCPPTGRRRNPSYKFLHRNGLLLVSPEDASDEVQDNAQPSVDTPAMLECHPQSLSSSEWTLRSRKRNYPPW